MKSTSIAEAAAERRHQGRRSVFGRPFVNRGVVEQERVGTPFPYIFLCGNGVPIDIFVPVGTAFPLPEFLLVHGQVTIIFVVSVDLSVCLFVCLFVCAESDESAVLDPISIKLGHMLYVWV